MRVEEAGDVVDLGCGPGDLTVGLLGRWPRARVIGVDSSAAMLADAAERHAATGVRFEAADLRDWVPHRPVDVVVCNATLHWVPGHLGLLARFAGWLAPGGALAVQVPGNFAAPSHQLVARTLDEPQSGADVRRAAREHAGAVHPPADYLRTLVDAGLEPDVWETTYLHVLPGEDAVLEWLRGTTLRPVLAAFGADTQARDRFLARLGERLRAAYPQQAFGTVLPFRRIFLVGHRAA